MDLRNLIRMMRMTSGCIFPSLFIATLTQAAMPDGLYKQALLSAEKKAAKNNATSHQSQALSATFIKTVIGRYYEVGDEWTLAAWQLLPAGPINSKDLPLRIGPGSLFKYEVLEVRTGPNAATTVRITPLVGQEGFPDPDPDPKISYVQLLLDGNLIPREKSYAPKGAAAELPGSPFGIRSKISSLEYFPLDLPQVDLSDKNEGPLSLPKLPKEIQELANRLNFKPDLSQSFSFSKEDLFGKPVEILWEHGDLWPFYIKTSNGLAILVKRGLR